MEQYISKSALIAEIEKRRSKNARNRLNLAAAFEDNYLLSFLNTLEVKEVDLEKEIEEVKHIYKVDDNRHTSICSADIEWLAKHFFENGSPSIRL